IERSRGPMRLPPPSNLLLAVCLVTAAAAASLDDSLLRQVEAQIIDEVERQVTDSVEQQVTDSVEQAVTEAVEQQVADSVEQAVTDSVEQQVTEAVEQSVTDSVEQSVTDSVEQTVTDAVEQAVTDAVEQAVTDTVEQTVTGTVEQQVVDAVERVLIDGIEGQITDAVEQTVESAVIDQLLDSTLDTAAGSAVDAVKAALSGLPAKPLPNLPQTAMTELGLARVAALAPGDAASELASKDIPPPADETFFETLDEDGWAVERDTWVVLVPMVSVAEIDGWSLQIRERRTLPGLDVVMLRVEAPSDRTLAGFARLAAASAPGTRVGRNHIYRLETGDTTSAGAAGGASIERARSDGDRPLRLGIIDSTVNSAHPALARANFIERDFVSYSGRRPADHGTAVASLLVGDDEGLSGLLAPGGSLHAASVFFEDEFGVVRATSTGLIHALDWMRQEGVDIVNMSLTGPPNLLLEQAITTAVAAGMLVVAAVGNNGPNGQPLYPAAYQTVIGVTAVDADHQVYRFANRGPQVAFAALGVGVRVAAADGGYRNEEGTSLAAPVVAARLAHLSGSSPATIIEALKALAIDLDPPGFNEVYGFGLVVGGP
ncbi:MAG: S8 family serine peptidase, partial [Gammaproteobacteria bacterium]|nr:S8 family serine peptidase [Gammaproteobacteria bacterium]